MTMKITPILFLDLDGTVRERRTDIGQEDEPKNVTLFDGMTDLIKSYKSKGWRVVSISNQGGIAMGYITDRAVGIAMQETNRLCANLFDRMFWCTHHPKALEESQRECFCRKPNPFYIYFSIISLSAEYKEQYLPSHCLFVGDMIDDQKCAENAGIPFMHASDWRKKGQI
jgi:histidinol-phosphate phosphatase family protein